MKIRPSKGSKTGFPIANITPVKNALKENIVFSFKYLCSDNDKFPIPNVHHSDFSTKQDYYLKLLQRLKDITSMKCGEFRQSRSHALRAHKINWDQTTETAGFNIPKWDELGATPYQFEISQTKYGRVHGFLIDTAFYVVWLDHNHELYP